MSDYDFLPDSITPEPVEPVQAESTGLDGKPIRLYKKTQQAVDLVINHGVDPKTALFLAKGKPSSRAAVHNFKEKVSKLSLTRPAMQKLASNAVKDVLQGKVVEIDAEKVLANGERVTYTERIAPTYTNKLAAAAMVADRVEPIVRQSVNLNVDVEICPVDLSRYSRTLD